MSPFLVATIALEPAGILANPRAGFLLESRLVRRR
jgi:hypothetical protein